MSDDDRAEAHRLKKKIERNDSERGELFRLRDANILRMRQEGLTLAEIGVEHGITRVRVRHVVERNGGLQDAQAHGKVKESA